MQTSTHTPTPSVADLEEAAELISEVFDSLHPAVPELAEARTALHTALVELGTASGILKILGLLPAVSA